MSATVRLPNGQPAIVGYDILLDALVKVEWVIDEQPVSWNYATDTEVTQKDYYHEIAGMEIHSISLDPSGIFIIDDNEDLPVDQFQKALAPLTIRHLLDPKEIERCFTPYFKNTVEKMKEQ